MKTTRKQSSGLTALALLPLYLLLGLFANCTASQPPASTLQSLQGKWEGFALGREDPSEPYVKSSGDSKITITITGNSLYFHRDEDFWWDTTFTLPASTGPKQLHATIKRPEKSAGDVVIAFFKIEDGTLTLGGIRSSDSEAEWPKTFETTEDTMSGRYELRKVQSEKEPAGGPVE